MPPKTLNQDKVLAKTYQTLKIKPQKEKQAWNNKYCSLPLQEMTWQSLQSEMTPNRATEVATEFEQSLVHRTCALAL